MDFSWSEEQKNLFDTISRFASRELNHNLIENDRNATFNHDGWTKCGELGISGLTVPEAYGGTGLDPLTTVGALERLGYSCRDNGLVFSLNAHLWTACMPLVAFGTEEQKRRFLPGLCSGKLIGGNAMSEPDSGSDAYALRTTATRKGDRYILNGSKTFITNGPVAGVIVTFATVDKSKGVPGISAFLVEKSFPGFSVASNLEKMGLRTSPTSELFFDECEVPETNLLGKEGYGSAVFTHAMTWERGCILASARLDAAPVGNVHQLRQRAEAVRPTYRQIPTRRQQDRGHEAAPRDCKVHALPQRLPALKGPHRDRRGGPCQAAHQRMLGPML